MRGKNVTQLGLFDQTFEEMMIHVGLDQELEKIDQILEDMPECVDLVHKDLQTNKTETGRKGIKAETVLRCAILKTLKRLTYRGLRDAINGNIPYRWFTRFKLEPIPHYTALQKLIKSIKPETFENLLECILKYARESKIEKGKTVRVDTTVVETDIGYPVDAKLLKDSVRVLTRYMQRARDYIDGKEFSFANRVYRAKKRSYQIVMAKGPKADEIRKTHYKDLIKVANEVYAMAVKCANLLKGNPGSNAVVLYESLDHFLTLSAVAIAQCERRVLKGETVPVDEKIVSIFESHTDIIKRGKSQCPTEFGHKVLFVTGKSGLITQYRTYQGNPGDNTMVKDILENHIKQFSSVPRKFAGDRRFFSADNEAYAKEAGVLKMSICKPGYRSTERKETEKKSWFKALQKFRAGIEGTISALMRGCGLKRCLWKGWRSFQSYVGLSVLTFNLRKLATI